MIDDERNELFRNLLEVLRDAGFSWVVDEVTALVSQGTEERVSAAEWTGSGKPTKGEFRATRREYAPIERIELLVGAVERVVKDGIALELAISDFFGETSAVGGAPTQLVQFVPEPDRDRADEDAFEMTSRSIIADRSEAVGTLLESLGRVRSEASR